MKMYKKILLLLLAVVSVSAAKIVQDTYTLSKGYAVTINGTSNLHNWTETVGTVTGESAITWNTDGSFNLETVNIKMDAHSIKSDMSAMDNNTYKALKVNAHPDITFALTAPVKSIQAKASEKTFVAKGNLTIAGVTKPVDMQVKAFMQGEGNLQFEGTQAVKMTDYGVTPPVALFGTLKTGDGITITFKTNFIKAK